MKPLLPPLMILIGGALNSMSGELLAAAPSSSKTSKPWKYNVDILRSPQYEALGQAHLYCDDGDHLWLPVTISFDAKTTTDAWIAQRKDVLLLSEDKGLSWRITDRRHPNPPDNRQTLPDGRIVRTETGGWVRYPRTEILRLKKQGYYVWDLGEKQGYCAVIKDMWMHRSRDGGKTWQKTPLHEQLPAFAHFVPMSLHIFGDGRLLNFAYGYPPELRRADSPIGGLSSVYCLRSGDGGETWKLAMIADGKLSPTRRGFNEAYPVVYRDGRALVLLRAGAGAPVFFVSTDDFGETWREPRITPISAKHPRPTLLRDGTILVTYQRRFARPFGVRARFTTDFGKTWSDEIVLHDDISVADGLHQPNTVELSDGTLFTAFDAKKYDDQGRPWPFVGGIRWSRNYRGPHGPKLDVTKPSEKFNSKRPDE